MKERCTECSGMGTVTDIDVNASICPFTEALCHACDGEGEIEATCLTCESPLRDDGWCPSCEDWETEVVGDPLLERKAA